MRIDHNVLRDTPITITVDGEAVTAYPGETIASVLLQRSATFRLDGRGKARGLFCNMGTCSECLVTLEPSHRRVRACIVPAIEGMEIKTRG